jgi:hexosaminidase
MSLTLCLLLLCLGASAAHHVWPPPKSIAVAGARLPLSAEFAFALGDGAVGASASRLPAAMAKFHKIVHAGRSTDPKDPNKDADPRDASLTKDGASSTASPELARLELRIAAPRATAAAGGGGGGGPFEAYPSLGTDYSYSLHINGAAGAYAEARSQYGLMYAMETFAQLVATSSLGPGNHLVGDKIYVEDAADYAWRGIMIDSGRRFVPVDTLKNIIDTAAAVKMNVLHLHASDMCRFGVESKKYPNLTAALTGIHAGFYSQDDVRGLVEYAANAGLRLVPEFDVPGHSRGFRPLMGAAGVQYCRGDSADDNQLFNDPAGKTYGVIRDVLQEMSTLFPDDVFNIGCDETAVVDDCTLNSTFAFERKLFKEIDGTFKKTPAGWEEAAFDAGAATPRTIVDAWSHRSAAEVIAKGWRAIESNATSFYMTEAVKGGPDGWKRMWYDIATGVPTANRSALLGGEISMWTDTYCYIDQCGAFGPNEPVPVGAPLFSPSKDAEFAKSLGGMIWPRGYVGAAAFWSFNATQDPTSAAFVEGVWALNEKLQKRGQLVCPTKCSCDQLSSCGKPYIAAA